MTRVAPVGLAKSSATRNASLPHGEKSVGTSIFRKTLIEMSPLPVAARADSVPIGCATEFIAELTQGVALG